MRLVALGAALMVCGCGRYGEFTLPVEREAGQGSWEWAASREPVLQRGEGWESVDVLNPSVFLHDGTYYNFYSGFDGNLWHTGLATSADGSTWLRKGRVLSGTDYIAANGSALHDGREFLYWHQVGKTPRIWLARSTDAKNWTSREVLGLGPRGSWDERGAADPYVVRFGGFYYLYYLGQDRAMRQRLGVARSKDGVEWTKLRSNPVLELGEFGAFDENGLGEPAVWRSNGSYWMLYTGRDRRERRRMGLAKSQDGVRWTKLTSPVIAGEQDWNRAVVCDATVEVTPDAVRVWFGGGNRPRPDERIDGQIGYGILRWRDASGAGAR